MNTVHRCRAIRAALCRAQVHGTLIKDNFNTSQGSNLAMILYLHLSKFGFFDFIDEIGESRLNTALCIFGHGCKVIKK
jgi:hypothetical protein